MAIAGGISEVMSVRGRVTSAVHLPRQAAGSLPLGGGSSKVVSPLSWPGDGLSGLRGHRFLDAARPRAYPQACPQLGTNDTRVSRAADAQPSRSELSGRGDSAKPDTILRNDEKSGLFWGGFCETRGQAGGRRPGLTDSRSWWMCFGCLRTVGCSASWGR